MFGNGDMVDVHALEGGNRGVFWFQGVIIQTHHKKNDSYSEFLVRKEKSLHPGVWVSPIQLILVKSAWKDRMDRRSITIAYNKAMEIL